MIAHWNSHCGKMRGTQKAEKNTGKQGSYILFKNVRGEDFYAIFG